MTSHLPVSSSPSASSSTSSSLPSKGFLSCGVSDSSVSKLPSPFIKYSISGVGTGRNRDPVFIDDEGFSAKHFIIPSHYEKDIERVLIPSGMIRNRIEKLAFDILQAYGDEEVHVLCVLKGSRCFFGKLLSYLNKLHIYSRPESQTPPYMEHYVRLKSYINDKKGQLQVISEDLSSLRGKHVLIVEDIVDTGETLEKFCKWLQALEPLSIGVASLLEKRTDKFDVFRGDFIGFSVPDNFVVGFSLDYNERYRDLEHICILNKRAQNMYRSET